MLGYVLAYAIAFKAGRWKNLMLVLVIAPFFTSFLVRTLSWKLILADDGYVVDLLQSLHLLGEDGRLLATPVAVVAGLTYNFLPFMVLPLFASIDKIDLRLIEASNDLYANPVVGFFKVTWPLSLPGVVSGTLLTFIPAAGDYINAQLLGSPNQRMIGSVIQSLFTDANNYPIAACALDDPDAAHPGDGALLRPPRRDGGAALMTWIRRNLVLILGPARPRLHVHPDLRGRADELQRPGQPPRSTSFDGFTLHNWLNPCEDPSMCEALSRSIQIGLLSTIGATILGTLAAFALVRHSFHGRSVANLVIFLPMAAPEIVLGSSLLALFVGAGFAGQLGFWTILIAHIMFCLSFVVVTVRSRLAGMGDTLEQAAAGPLRHADGRPSGG